MSYHFDMMPEQKTSCRTGCQICFEKARCALTEECKIPRPICTYMGLCKEIKTKDLIKYILREVMTYVSKRTYQYVTDSGLLVDIKLFSSKKMYKASIYINGIPILIKSEITKSVVEYVRWIITAAYTLRDFSRNVGIITTKIIRHQLLAITKTFLMDGRKIIRVNHSIVYVGSDDALIKKIITTLRSLCSF